MKEATEEFTAITAKILISIHASAKEATRNNPFRFCLFETISIHASAKEATLQDTHMSRPYTFQSTPPRRRRQLKGGSCFIWQNFNPRLREGGDANVPAKKPERVIISIHASAKEATFSFNCISTEVLISIHASAKEATTDTGWKRWVFYHFNPRLREGGDALIDDEFRKTILFQSTPPRRRRPRCLSLSKCCLYFNPRLREGGDSYFHEP